VSTFAFGLLVAVISLGAAIVLRRQRTHAIASSAVAAAGLLVALGAAVVAGPPGPPLPGLSLVRIVEDLRLAGWEVACTRRECAGRWERLGVRYEIAIRRVDRDRVGTIKIAVESDRPTSRQEILRPLEYPVAVVSGRAAQPSVDRLRRLLRTGGAPASWQTQNIRFTMDGNACDRRRALACRLTIEPAR
jgi:hypothetical protein